MANHFFSINRGTDSAKSAAITAATSTTSGDDIELRLADAAGLTKKDVDILVERVLDYVRNVSTFPPL